MWDSIDPELGAKNVTRLNGRRFDQADLSEMGFSSDTVINWERKYGLHLCSPPPGRGRARKFCLIDVYLLSLVRQVLTMTGALPAAVQAANDALMGYFGEEQAINAEEIEEFKIEYENNIYDAPAYFYRREVDYFIWTSGIEGGFSAAESDRPFDPINKPRNIMLRRRGLYLNLTFIFYDADICLVDTLEKRYGKGSFWEK